MIKYYILVLLFITSVSFADPDITGVSGQTITGTGFGTKATAAPIKFDTFESYTVGGNILSSGTSPQWINDSGNSVGYPEVSNTRSHSGTKSVYSDFTITGGDESFTFAWVTFSDTDDFYETYWVYWVSATGVRIDGPRANWFKMSRVSADVEYSGPPVQRPEFWTDYGIPEGLETPRGYLQFHQSSNPADLGDFFVIKTPGGTSNDFTHGSWHRVEIFSHLSATEGETTLVIDGVTQTFSTDSGDPNETRVSTSSQGYNIYILELSGAGFTETEHPYMWQDDVYVDNTRARVEIGNASTWASVTHKEIQPATAWATGEITFTENQGTLGSTGYLYVVDAGNLVNSTGTLYTFGEEETPTITPGITITGARIQ